MFVIPTFQVFERLVAPELPAVDVVSKSLSWLELLFSRSNADVFNQD